MSWFRDFVYRLLKVVPAKERQIVITEPLSFRANVLKNRIWYRGDPAELEQFFRAAAHFDTDKSRFWASVPYGKVRKIHSGLPGVVIDRYKDIVTADFDGFDFGEDESVHPMLDRWIEIEKDSDFTSLLGDALAGALSTGDGAFKISIDPNETYPVVSFYEADNVDYLMNGRKVTALRFYTPYKNGNKDFRLEEEYGAGYVKYRLFDDTGKEVPLNTLEETSDLHEVTFQGNFVMAVPFMIFGSTKWRGRGKALFDSKTDDLDALDEVVSQWLDAVRMGRVKRYIPEDMIPRDPQSGQLIDPNPFDNDFIAVGSLRTEGAQEKIDVSQPQISYEAYVSSYAAFMDLCLQGIMSPATLGIDLKKTDNAEAQREKEKVTLHVRGKIVDALNSALPVLVERILKADDLMHGPTAGDYEVAVRFGEYASPDFDSTVDTVVKAKSGGVMSIEQSVEELYGDTWTREQKDEEIARLKEEQGIATLDEPFEGMAGGEDDEGDGGEQDLSDGDEGGGATP